MPEIASGGGRRASTQDATLTEASAATALGTAETVVSLAIGPTAQWGPAPASVRVASLLASGFFEWPTVVNLVRLWDESMGWRITDLNATSLRLSFNPTFDAVAMPSVLTALNDLARWTDLPNDRLGYVLGASRRSIYNWRQGAAVPSETTGRILRAYEALLPLALRRPPAVLRSWLGDGDPSPDRLIREGRWDDLQTLVDSQVRAVSARLTAAADDYDDSSEPMAFSAETRKQILDRFRTATQLAPRRRGWRPRELTGLGDEEMDDL